MYYNEMCGERVSALGFGAMRMPVNDGELDYGAVDDLVALAIEGGINYFDTGYTYHGGKSEGALGKALANSGAGRDDFFVADKFPGYDLANFGNHEQIFEEQLERMGLDHFDFYLLHNVHEFNIERYLDEARYHTMEYLLEQREAGRIRHLGFSAHGQSRTLQRLLSAFGEDLEFGQLQVNWMDWTFQEASDKVQMLRSRGIPVVVMEPLRGGRLIELDDQTKAELEEACPGQTAAEWGFRFIQRIKGVAVTLSGPSSVEMLEQNLRTFEAPWPLSADEKDLLVDAGERIAAQDAVPCTRCLYCTSHCPQYLNIPDLIAIYNEYRNSQGRTVLASMALGALKESQRPSACIGCKRCEIFCPQTIEISEVMRKLKEEVKPK